MSFTRTQLELLEAAIASGTLEVRIGDKLVRYQGLADLIKARDLVKDALCNTCNATRTSISSFARD